MRIISKREAKTQKAQWRGRVNEVVKQSIKEKQEAKGFSNSESKITLAPGRIGQSKRRWRKKDRSGVNLPYYFVCAHFPSIDGFLRQPRLPTPDLICPGILILVIGFSYPEVSSLPISPTGAIQVTFGLREAFRSTCYWGLKTITRIRETQRRCGQN